MDTTTCPIYTKALAEVETTEQRESYTEAKKVSSKKTGELTFALVAPLFFAMASVAVSMGVLFRVISHMMGLNI